MAAAVYGGSPRHHSRMLVTNSGSNNDSGTPAHLQPTLILQQSTPFVSGSNHQLTNNIIVPSVPYLTPSQAQKQHNAFIHSQRNYHSKRKSAVELLAETKQYYVKSETVRDRNQYLNFSRNNYPIVVSPSKSLPHHRLANRRSASSSSDLLQTKLRKLLNASDKEQLTSESLNKYQTDTSLNCDTLQFPLTKLLNQELTVHPESSTDTATFFPSAFLSPQSLPPHPSSDDNLYAYGIHDDDDLKLTDDYGTISPPAEYAENKRSNEKISKYGYQRSYSHSQNVTKDSAEYSPSYNSNSHKSLPDLHSQASRHSPHSEVLSCCSRGNRSNKSSSSFNRDSGGSSGHYTHRSEPCYKQKEPLFTNSSDFRRDSGSSTQHSGNSYYNNIDDVSNYRYDCVECRAKLQEDAECLLNFTTPVVPEEFQDDYNAVTKLYYDESPKKYQNNKYINKTPPPPPPTHLPEIPITPPDLSDLSPPLGTFKRQKCLRFKYKNRYNNQQQGDDRRPILRSKSDISDRYWNRTMPIIDSNKIDKRIKSDSMAQLENFFDRLGLNDETYEQYISQSTYTCENDSEQSSPVFFSDVSTVDSNRLPDSTEVNQCNTAIYRTSEPPSVVERNARIIKWLCNCKKLQLT